MELSAVSIGERDYNLYDKRVSWNRAMLIESCELSLNKSVYKKEPDRPPAPNSGGAGGHYGLSCSPRIGG